MQGFDSWFVKLIALVLAASFMRYDRGPLAALLIIVCFLWLLHDTIWRFRSVWPKAR